MHEQNDRHIRVASLLKEFAATFIAHEANTDPMITVTRVGVSPDYKNTTVYITTIPNERAPDALIFLQRHASELRQQIKKKSNLKIIPHIQFEVDYGERHRQHIDELARKIDTKN